MASPIVESLCCVPEATDLSQYFLSTFRTPSYNVVCLVSSLLGVAGALWQLYIMRGEPETSVRQRRPRMLRTQGPLIVKYLAIADLCAAGGIAVRSALWLWDVHTAGKGLDPTQVSTGRLVCVLIASWIHYFYTCTYIWTCLYCVDCVRSVRGTRTNIAWYHAAAWLLPALLTAVGLFGLYAPDMQCHSSGLNPYLRFLPNYLSTVLPLLVVLCVCPVLYCAAARGLHLLMAAVTGRYTSSERAVVAGVRRRFLLLCLVFWICWIPNIINAVILWISWDTLPFHTLTALWYAMAVLNPLQAVFNSFVYPSRSARNSILCLGPAHRCSNWLTRVATCGLWPRVICQGKVKSDTDDTRQIDVVQCDVYDDASSSEYQSASSSPRTLGNDSPTDETMPLLGPHKAGGSALGYTTM